ncbi:PAS fold [Chromobacterium violaceum]|uniref:PAS fold n=1 Tax=Chromobacterium violaceum TaxID=536 RepID=A0A447TBB0_CHRVL|nr:PAS fold [Chromobacterium violaceum]
MIGSFTLFLSPVARPTPADAIPPVLMNTLSQLILANQDQQALQRADRQLAQQQAQLAAVIDTSIDGIVTLDRTGFIVTANAVAERIFGFPPACCPASRCWT